MNYIDAVKAYIPKNEQEKADREFFLSFAENNPNCLLRDNKLAHFTASAWIVNPDRSKVLMVYHNIYKSWSWTGGHADGEEDMAQVALREVIEETGVKSARLVSEEPISLEMLTVDGHFKRGEYVRSHLHLNLTYLVEADEADELFIKPDENSGVRWFTPSDMFAAVSEPWMAENVYKKLCERVQAPDMKHICALTDKEILGTEGLSKALPRLTARAIVRRADGLYAVMYAEKFGIYTLPGGGIDPGETPLEALRREIDEETGCECEAIEELGIIEENRFSLDYTQINYYYIVHTSGPRHSNHLTDVEKAGGTVLQWHTPEKAFELISSPSFERVQGKYLQARDVAALREYIAKHTAG